MARLNRKENPLLHRTLIELHKAARKHEVPLWAAVADELLRPRHQRPPLNVGHLERLAVPKETVVIPGKLLAAGRLTKPLTVAAFHYSEEARAKIHAVGGTTMSIHELVHARPEGTGVRLLA